MSDADARPAATADAPAEEPPARDAAGERSTRVTGARAGDLALAGVVLAGCAGRVAGWVAPRTYSHDEISLLFSLRTLPVGRLLAGPLLRDQGAPLLWLAVERAVLAVAGPGERAMRAFPLLLTCLSVVLVALLAREVLSRPAAVAATALFATAPLATFYAWQVKPYGADMAVAAALVLLAVALTRRREWGWRHGVAWWGAAALGAGFSFPSLFLAGGVGAALVAARLLAPPEAATAARDRLRQCVRFCLPAALWLGAAATVYALQLRHLSGLQDDYPMWLSGYGPEGAGPRGYLQWTYDLHSSLVNLVWLAPLTWAVLVLVLVGAVSLAHRDRAAFLVVAAVPAVAFLAALFHVYPEKGRLALWVVPSLVILVAEPVWPWRADRQAPRVRTDRAVVGQRLAAAAVAVALAATVAVPATRSSVAMVAHPERSDLALRSQGTGITRLLDLVRAGYRPGDRLIAQEAYYHKALWYGHERGIDVAGVLAFRATAGDCHRDAYRRAARDARRLWFIGGESWLVTTPRFVDVALAHLRTLGRVTAVARQDGATLYRVDLTEPPDARTAPPADQAPCARFASWRNPLE